VESRLTLTAAHAEEESYALTRFQRLADTGLFGEVIAVSAYRRVTGRGAPGAPEGGSELRLWLQKPEHVPMVIRYFRANRSPHRGEHFWGT
jgi:hypothetical protein